ncbi:MAG: hypothetical protein QHJ73_15145, partial [Armatimonadota bacterium]|nr:hypothetical protein [Armatimonadota bacterium]
MRSLFLSLALCWVAAAPLGAEAVISIPAARPLLRYGAEELRQTLTAAGVRATVVVDEPKSGVAVTLNP